jgi:hypothetical protein
MALTQIERDLQKFTQDKLRACIGDVARSFEIAGIKTDALPCLGVELLRAAAAFCIFCDVSKAEFLERASEFFDRARAQLERANDHQHDAN